MTNSCAEISRSTLETRELARFGTWRDKGRRPVFFLRTDLLSFISDFTAENGRHLSRSKSCPAICHKLIYGIAIIHSINFLSEKTCIAENNTLFIHALYNSILHWDQSGSSCYPKAWTLRPSAQLSLLSFWLSRVINATSGIKYAKSILRIKTVWIYECRGDTHAVTSCPIYILDGLKSWPIYILEWP